MRRDPARIFIFVVSLFSIVQGGLSRFRDEVTWSSGLLLAVLAVFAVRHERPHRQVDHAYAVENAPLEPPGWLRDPMPLARHHDGMRI